MKVRLLILIAVALAILGTMALQSGTAKADGGPHGGFNLTTGACPDCHRTHTGASTKLIADASIYALCTSCHGNVAGSHLEDVIDGIYLNTTPRTGAVNGPLKGGGFVNTTMATAATITGTVGSTAVTSAHQVQGMTGYTSDTVWGFGALGGPNANTSGLTSFTLQCSTCHDPHGGAGSGTHTSGSNVVRNGTYRLLRTDIGQKLGQTVNEVTVNDTTNHWYTISDTTNDWYYGQTYDATSDKGTNNDLPTTLSNWCSTCHTRIHTSDNTGTGSSGPAETTSGDSIFTFRHPTTGSNVVKNFDPTKPAVDSPGDLPGVGQPVDAPSCLTCHVAHGSSATTALEYGTTHAVVQYPGTSTYVDSTLLRLNGYGTCEECHNK